MGSTNEPSFSHLDESGNARMVDVGGKSITRREAVASALVRLGSDCARKVREAAISKGDVLQTAKLAGISAAKRTDELIPLCHTLPLDSLDIVFQWCGDADLEIRAVAKATSRTGVEMEAMTAVSIAALTVYDMCKSVTKGIVIDQVRLISKTGGKSGDWHAN
ncbi:MAG: cyclic pyranopterin monophosphate synthase MoaC [Pirellulales bacterium]